MRIAILIYAVVYAALTAATIIDDFRSRKSLMDKFCDSVLLPMGLVGIVLFVWPVHGTEVKIPWRFIAPIVVVGLAANNLLARYRAIRDSKVTRDEKIVGDVVTTVLLVPMFVINLVYAYT